MDGLEQRRLRLAEILGGVAGVAVEYHGIVSSTQSRARELARSGTRLAVVAADGQTEGRGRFARRWESIEGCGLFFSVLFRPALPPASAHLVNAAAALSVAEAVKRALNAEPRLKWPNDLLIESEAPDKRELKVCGILSESAVQGGRLDYCVTGIGINLREPPGLPPEVAARAGWLCRRGETVDDLSLLGGVVKIFFAWIGAMEREGTERMLGAYRERCVSIGRTVRVETGEEILTGLCAGVGDEGELILETHGGLRRFYAADVTHARVVLLCP